MFHSKQKGMFHVLCHQTSEICKAGLPFCLGIKISISLACDILPVIAKQLLRNLSVSQLISFMFECFLKVHAIKWILCSVIGRGNRNNNGRICVFPTSARITHTIDTGFFLHGGSIYDITARTHAKGIYPASVWKIGRHLIGCGRKPQSVSFSVSVHGIIDHLLGMFHAESHGKIFGFHRKLVPVQHHKGIPCTVSKCKNGNIGRNHRIILRHKCMQCIFFYLNVF